ncbi:unnamed protein product [Peniophora sp. CBMAI 1063]|nr:unnamed protein product [Peniophora sp. CBMAI 1063]
MAAPPSKTPSRMVPRTSLSTSKPRTGSVSTVTPLSGATNSRPGDISRTNSTGPTSFNAAKGLSLVTETGSISGARSPSVSVANRRLSAIPTAGLTTGSRSPNKPMSMLTGVGLPSLAPRILSSASTVSASLSSNRQHTPRAFSFALKLYLELAVHFFFGIFGIFAVLGILYEGFGEGEGGYQTAEPSYGCTHCAGHSPRMRSGRLSTTAKVKGCPATGKGSPAAAKGSPAAKNMPSGPSFTLTTPLPQAKKRQSTSPSVVAHVSPGQNATPRKSSAGSIGVGASPHKIPGSGRKSKGSGASVMVFAGNEGANMTMMLGSSIMSGMDESVWGGGEDDGMTLERVTEEGEGGVDEEVHVSKTLGWSLANILISSLKLCSMSSQTNTLELYSATNVYLSGRRRPARLSYTLCKPR